MILGIFFLLAYASLLLSIPGLVDGGGGGGSSFDQLESSMEATGGILYLCRWLLQLSGAVLTGPCFPCRKPCSDPAAGSSAEQRSSVNSRVAQVAACGRWDVTRDGQ